MKESRVQKYQQYRDSISKEDSKTFHAPQTAKEVSKEMGLFLKLQRKKNIENIVILSLIFSVILVLLIFGFVLF